MIAPAIVKQLELQTFVGTPMTGVGGTGVQPSQETVLRRMTVGSLERTDTVAAVSNEIDALSSATGVPFSGIIGYPVFGEECAIFDFVSGRAIF